MPANILPGQQPSLQSPQGIPGGPIPAPLSGESSTGWSTGAIPNVLPGAPPQAGFGPWGGVPSIPNPVASAGSAISGDIANLGPLFGLAGQINQFNTGAALAPYQANLPGYTDMVSKSSQNIGSLLQGQIPQDVMALLAQSSAERGAASGMPDAPASNSAYERALGLTSLGLQQTGEQDLTAAIQRTPVPQLFNVAQFLTTPNDYQAAATAANIYAAAPNPAMNAQALIDLFTRMMGSGGGVRGGVQTSPGGGGGSPYQFPSGAGVGGGGGSPGYTGSLGGGASPIQSQPGQGPNIGGALGNMFTVPSQGGPQLGLGPSYGPAWPGGPTVNPSGPGSDWWNSPDPYGALSNIDWGLPSAGTGTTSTGTSPATTDWWNAQDPWSALSGIDWGTPPPDTSSPAYDWTQASDPWAALSGIDWGQPMPSDYSGAITNDFSFLGPADTGVTPSPSYGGYNFGGGYNYSTGYGG